jgi:hypothetical protein
MTFQIGTPLVLAIATALYKIAAHEVDRRLDHRRRLLERVRYEVDRLTAVAIRVQAGDCLEKELELGKRRLHRELLIVDPLPRSTELMTRSQLTPQDVLNQSEAAAVELSRADVALAPRPLVVSVWRWLRGHPRLAPAALRAGARRCAGVTVSA